MTRSRFRQIAIGLIAAPLALGLAACGDKQDEGAPTTSGEPIAPIAAPAGKSWNEMVARTEEGGYRLGNPEAPIKLVEYGALSCSHCAEFAKQSFTELQNDYVSSGRVSYELRFFMLNPYDLAASLLATCGSTEAVIPLAEQFWAWQPTMFENAQALGEERLQQISDLPPQQQIPAIAEATGMIDFFASRGISRDQANACLSDTAKAKAFAEQTEKAGREFNITGTPAFILNGSSIGSMGWNDMKTKLQQAGAR